MTNPDDILAQIDVLTQAIATNPDAPTLYFERGKLYWKIGNRAGAITDYNTAISLDPSSPARAHLDMANDILNFYNTDLYNP